MDRQSVTTWVAQVADGDQHAAEQAWNHISVRLKQFARQRLDSQMRRRDDENDAAYRNPRGAKSFVIWSGFPKQFLSEFSTD